MASPIEFDRENRKIGIRNNRPLYRAIKSGALLVIALEVVGEAAEALDGIGLLFTASVVGLYRLLSEGWDLVHIVTVSGSIATCAVTTATAKVTTR